MDEFRNDIYEPETTTEAPVYKVTPYPAHITKPYAPGNNHVKKSGVFRKLLVTMLAIAIGGAFLGLGISAGYIAMQHFMQTASTEEIYESPGFNTLHHEPRVIPIDTATPDFTDIIAEVKDSVVSIMVTAARRNNIMAPQEHHGAGSGFIFAQDDEHVFVATNHHVIADTSSVTISLDDNERVPARVIGIQPDYDLAVLAVCIEALAEKGVPFTIAEFGCSDSMRMGDSVVAIGNAMGAGQTVTKGIISARDLQINVRDQNANTTLTLDVLQTDAAVNQGNSGGPLINQNGEVIGIVTAKLFGHGIEGMGYVLPINDVRGMLEEMMIHGSERRAWLGIHSYEVDEDVRDMFNLPAMGMLIRIVTEGSPAYVAGLMEWDLLVRFDGHPITSREDLSVAMAERRPGDESVVGVYRNGVYLEFYVVLGSID
ncbi:MAG: trypsin-like peptidase domain-containing protein [Defluviitaleaceae bacterium]|nr:trypsin-like peptidase domain-containing protein [Defluviitaleaceae bacterium]